MSFSVIVSQGRVGDRTNGAVAGAKLAGGAIAGLIGVEAILVGQPSEARLDDWSASLPSAHSTLTGLRDALAGALEAGGVPVLATNTCAASLATLPEMAFRYPDAVVLWIDAHGDFNTPETTESGYLGGMVLAAACGLWDSGHGAGLDPRHVALVGARDIDPAEQRLLHRTGVTVLPPGPDLLQQVREFVGDRPVWIHVDWDVLEPGYIPAAYKVPGGLLPREVAAIFAALPAGAVRGLEFAEFEAGEPDIPDRLSVELIVETFQQIRWP